MALTSLGNGIVEKNWSIANEAPIKGILPSHHRCKSSSLTATPTDGFPRERKNSAMIFKANEHLVFKPVSDT